MSFLVNSYALGWTPSELGSALALWLDAADSSTITLNGSTVAQWQDKSGNGRHAVQGTAANQPTYLLSNFNSKNAVSFDGGDFLDNLTNGVTGTGTYAGPLNLFYAATRTSASGGAILTERQTTLVKGFQLLSVSAAQVFISSDGLHNSSNHAISTTSYNRFGSSGAIASHSHVPGSRDNYWINSTQETVTTGTATNITGNAGFRIGGREGSVGGLWQGVMLEVMATTSALTTADRQRLEGYLAHKWGLVANLPSDHPYKIVAP